MPSPSPSRLPPADLELRLAQLPPIGTARWQVLDGALAIDLAFASFSDAIAFMVRTALHAERLDHHPDWRNVYNRVAVRLSTHSAGGITALDFELAAAVQDAALRLLPDGGVAPP